MDAGHFNLTSGSVDDLLADDAESQSPSRRQYRQDLATSLFEGANTSKILAFKAKAPQPKEGHQVRRRASAARL